MAPPSGLLDVDVLVGALLLVLLGADGLACGRRVPGHGSGLAWLGLAWLPVSNLHPIAAVVVAKPGVDLQPTDVLRWCHERLPRFKLPAQVRIIDALPRTTTGKLARAELKTWYGERRST